MYYVELGWSIILFKAGSLLSDKEIVYHNNGR